VLEAAVDRLGGPVAGAGSIEVGQHVGSATFSVRPSVISSVSAVGTAAVIVAMILFSSVFAATRSWLR
jgi:hypothetical protein